MHNLDDGHDEVLTRPVKTTPEQDYVQGLTILKWQKRGDVVDIYTSPEFIAIKKRLKEMVGEMEANRIMEKNL